MTATKVRKQGAVASNSKMTYLASQFIKLNPYFWQII